MLLRVISLACWRHALVIKTGLVNGGTSDVTKKSHSRLVKTRRAKGDKTHIDGFTYERGLGPQEVQKNSQNVEINLNVKKD